MSDVRTEERHSCCCGSAEADGLHTHKFRDKQGEEYKGLIRRLNRIEGQIRGIHNMVDEDRYCVDILTQVSAVQSALNAFTKELLSQHIHSCVVEDIRSGNDAVVDELCCLLQKVMK